jgi:hypothetical protein
MNLTERFSKLEKHILELNQKHRQLQQENVDLQQKNALAKQKIEQILSQLTKMEATHE